MISVLLQVSFDTNYIPILLLLSGITMTDKIPFHTLNVLAKGFGTSNLIWEEAFAPPTLTSKRALGLVAVLPIASVKLPVTVAENRNIHQNKSKG